MTQAMHACTTVESVTASVYQIPTDSPEEIQERIRAYRNRLLAGRGPGASPAETAPFMRDRQWLGGVPAAIARQQEADQAALAGDDPPAVEDVIIRQRAQLSATLTILNGRLHTLRTRAVIGLRASLITAAAGAAAALAAQAALRRPAWRRASITGDRPGIGRPQTVTRQLRRASETGRCRRRRS